MSASEVFERGAVDLIERRELQERLAQGRPLRVKFGMDPSSPDLHVGHAVPLFKLRALQDAGHVIVLIVGDSTAMVGDPSGRNKLRPQLSREEVERNLETYVAQVSRVLDMSKTEVHRNSEWFDAMRFEDVLRLASRMTVARMLERDTFETRMAAKEPIGIHEFLYPLMQGWDSVQIRCDLELGGTDQLFNLLVGRALQEQAGQPGQICLTLPLINGLDGRKMSKSYGNSIGITESAESMFGKVMSITDDAMGAWYRLLTSVPQQEIDSLLAGSLRDAKARLGVEIASFFHGREAANAALDAFNRQFRDKQVPDDVSEVAYPGAWPPGGVPLANLLRDLKLCASSSDARRLVSQGGVKLDGVVASDPMQMITKPAKALLIQAGKRKYARLVG
jgi:tyrosyl-tRNA synthetase